MAPVKKALKQRLVPYRVRFLSTIQGTMCIQAVLLGSATVAKIVIIRNCDQKTDNNLLIWKARQGIYDKGFVQSCTGCDCISFLQFYTICSSIYPFYIGALHNTWNCFIYFVTRLYFEILTFLMDIPFQKSNVCL